MTKPRFIGYDATYARQIWLLELTHIHAPFDLSELQGATFVCLSAMNASSAQTDDLSAFCSHLIDHGCAYYCAWGPECERVHDIMDGLVVGDNPPETYIGCLMTTWHEKESLAEAVDFFLMCTVPNEEFAPIGCSFGLAVVVGSEDWASQIDRHVHEWIVASCRENSAKFKWGDSVLIAKDSPANLRPGSPAEIVGMSEPHQRQGSYLMQFPGGVVYTVEFADGSEAEVHEDHISPQPPNNELEQLRQRAQK